MIERLFTLLHRNNGGSSLNEIKKDDYKDALYIALTQHILSLCIYADFLKHAGRVQEVGLVEDYRKSLISVRDNALNTPEFVRNALKEVLTKLKVHKVMLAVQPDKCWEAKVLGCTETDLNYFSTLLRDIIVV